MNYPGSRYKTFEECMRDNLIPLEIARMLGHTFTPEQKGEYTCNSNVPVQNNAEKISNLEKNTQFSVRQIKQEIQALKCRCENAEQLIKAQHEHIKKLTEGKLMSKCGCNGDRKDAEDYVVNNDHDIEFIKTHDGRYIKAKEIRGYRCYYSISQNEHIVIADSTNENYTIEKFKDTASAEHFLEELVNENVSQ